MTKQAKVYAVPSRSGWATASSNGGLGLVVGPVPDDTWELVYSGQVEIVESKSSDIGDYGGKVSDAIAVLPDGRRAWA